jgi:hypothetical protein
MRVTLEKPTINEIQIIRFPQYKRMSMFLILLLYTMGLATFVSIQIGLMHLSPKNLLN